MGIISRKSAPPGFLTTREASSAVSGALQVSRGLDSSGSLDDFSLVSSSSTYLPNSGSAKGAHMGTSEGLGISTNIDSSDDQEPSFSQTKRSSDDLVAASSTQGTPDSSFSKVRDRIQEESEPSTPTSPSPQTNKTNPESIAHRSGKKGQQKENAGPDHVPMYKIALASHILLSPSGADS
jgi:hypothetical protein